MKLKLTILLLLPFFAAVAQEFKTPLEYLNYIEKESSNISKSTWKYTSAVAHSKSARKIDKTRNELIKNIQNASKKIQALKNGYKGDTDYRDQLIAYFAISESQINQEYSKIINMQDVAEQSYDFMEAYIMTRDLVNKKIDEEVRKLNANQKIFAGKYGITISEDESEIGKKMEISNQVFENHTQLYLIFFKVNITEANLMKAIEARDLNAIQQNSNALQQYAEEGLGKLKTFAAYKNDQMLVNATKKMLEFSKKEALEFTPGIVSFFMLNQKFEESKKAIDAKPESERTKLEIDNFNKLVAQVNKEGQAYNKLNAKFNTESNNLINNWNTTGEEFISKYVPQD